MYQGAATGEIRLEWVATIRLLYALSMPSCYQLCTFGYTIRSVWEPEHVHWLVAIKIKYCGSCYKQAAMQHTCTMR